jgi:hypothetical protein
MKNIIQNRLLLGEDFVKLMSKPSMPLKLDNFHLLQRLIVPISNALTAPFSRMLSLALFTMVDSDVEAAKERMRASGKTEEYIQYQVTCNAIKFAAKNGIRRISGSQTVTTDPSSSKELLMSVPCSLTFQIRKMGSRFSTVESPKVPALIFLFSIPHYTMQFNSFSYLFRYEKGV